MSKIHKTIYLARHAKSAWDTDAASDFDRPLSERGLRDANRVAVELKSLGWQPEKVVASPALRAKQTCNILCKAMNVEPQNIVWDTTIYAAYTIALLQILANQDESTTSVMLVGHNPSMEDLLIHLCGEVVVDKYMQMGGKLFTTANVAKISIDVPWKDLVMNEAQLDRIIRPKEI